MKKWIRAWETAGASLREIQIRSLRDPDYYRKNQMLLNEMLCYAFENRITRKTSGLIEMQKIFLKGRK